MQQTSQSIAIKLVFLKKIQFRNRNSRVNLLRKIIIIVDCSDCSLKSHCSIPILTKWNSVT